MDMSTPSWRIYWYESRTNEINNSINFYRFAFGGSQLQINRKPIAKGHKSKENEYENGNGKHQQRIIIIKNKKKEERELTSYQFAMFSANGSAPVEFQSTASYILHISYMVLVLSLQYIRHMANFAVHFRIVFHLPQPQQQNVTKLNYGTKQPSGKLIRRPFVVDVIVNTYTKNFEIGFL